MVVEKMVMNRENNTVECYIKLVPRIEAQAPQ